MCGPQVRFCERFPPANGGRLLDLGPAGHSTLGVAPSQKKSLQPAPNVCWVGATPLVYGKPGAPTQGSAGSQQVSISSLYQ